MSISVIEKRLVQLGLQLPEVQAQGNYKPAMRWKGLVITAGFVSRRSDDGTAMCSTLATENNEALAAQATRIAVLRAIAATKQAVNTLDDIQQVLSLRAYYQASPEFENHTRVLDTASDMLINIFGPQKGQHARTALGVVSLPNHGIAEIELMFGVD